MIRYVLDASALLSLLQNEPGSSLVEEALMQGSAMSTVNLSEVVSKLNEIGMPFDEIQEILNPLGIKFFDFDEETAYHAGKMRKFTKQAGLSFGDRACLALAERLSLTVLTSDRVWTTLRLSVDIQCLR